MPDNARRPRRALTFLAPVLGVAAVASGVLVPAHAHQGNLSALVSAQTTEGVSRAAIATTRTIAPASLSFQVDLPLVDGPRAAVPAKVERQVVIKKRTWVLPVAGYRLTGRYGDVSGLWSTVHTGLDFAAPYGTTIRSAAPGVVTEVGYAGAYGLRTIVRLPNGAEVWYCHQASTVVQPGQAVSAGQSIGTVGTSGNVTGPHLHLEVHRPSGEPVDPEVTFAHQHVRP